MLSQELTFHWYVVHKKWGKTKGKLEQKKKQISSESN